MVVSDSQAVVCMLGLGDVNYDIVKFASGSMVIDEAHYRAYIYPACHIYINHAKGRGTLVEN